MRDTKSRVGVIFEGRCIGSFYGEARLTTAFFTYQSNEWNWLWFMTIKTVNSELSIHPHISMPTLTLAMPLFYFHTTHLSPLLSERKTWLSETSSDENFKNINCYIFSSSFCYSLFQLTHLIHSLLPLQRSKFRISQHMASL